MTEREKVSLQRKTFNPLCWDILIPRDACRTVIILSGLRINLPSTHKRSCFLDLWWRWLFYFLSLLLVLWFYFKIGVKCLKQSWYSCKLFGNCPPTTSMIGSQTKSVALVESVCTKKRPVKRKAKLKIQSIRRALSISSISCSVSCDLPTSALISLISKTEHQSSAHKPSRYHLTICCAAT